MASNIYRIYCLKNSDKVIYIGCTSKPLHVRLSDHYYQARVGNKYPLYEYLRIFDNCVIERFAETENKNEAFALEKKLISAFRTTTDFGGFNQSLGGRGRSGKHSQKTINKISKTKQEQIASGAFNPPNKGKKFNDDWKVNLRKAKSSKMKKIKCIDDNLVFDSIKDASLHYGYTATGISRVVSGQRKRIYGKTFTLVAGG